MLKGKKTKLVLSIILFIFVVMFYFKFSWLKLNEDSFLENDKRDYNGVVYDHKDKINLVGVVCGDAAHVDEFMTMVKSAILFQKSAGLHFIVFTEPRLFRTINEYMRSYAAIYNFAFTYEIQKATHVNDEYGFVKNRGPLKCTMERLYFPDILQKYGKVLYVDADIIFLKDLSEIWNHFKFMNSTQICGVAADDTDPKTSFYQKSSEIPFYGPAGLNAAVLLMNLERMRQENWVKSVEIIAKIFRQNIYLADQDIINIYFHYQPEKLFLLPPRFSYSPYNCYKRVSECKDCETEGIAILHGFEGTFRQTNITRAEKNPMYLVYQAFNKYRAGTDPYKYLLNPLIRKLQTLDKGICVNLIVNCLQKLNIVGKTDIVPI